MPKKKKKIEEQKSEPVANCDQSNEVVTNCDNHQFAVTNCDHKNIDIKSMIRVIRGQQVMLDFELAMLYGVETKALNQAVKRNINRFPDDFMFQLTKKELDSLRSQIVTSNSIERQQDTNWKSQIVTSNFAKMGLRRPPYAFTRNGIGRRMKEDENRTHALRGSFSLFSFAKNWQKYRLLPLFSFRMTKGFYDKYSEICLVG